jgi:hypothetical protein
MDKKMLIVCGVVFSILPTLVNLGIFVTFPQMTAYAVSKDTMQIVLDKLNTIDYKIDKIVISEK